MARTREHRCGKCSWGGTGSTGCENYHGSEHPVPAVGDKPIWPLSPNRWWYGDDE